MIIEKLRERTIEYHDKFTEWSVDIFNGTITIEDYTFLLQTFFGIYSPIENQIGVMKEWELINFDFEKRRKAPLLRKDLKFLGNTDTEIDNLPVCKDIPELTSFSQALGCMYVFEGATIGGQILTKHLQQLFDFEGKKGHEFFMSYGDNVKLMWRSFGDMLVSYTYSKNSDEAIIKSALETYFKLHAWLSRWEKRK